MTACPWGRRGELRLLPTSIISVPSPDETSQEHADENTVKVVMRSKQQRTVCRFFYWAVRCVIGDSEIYCFCHW
jgi:hypothetical protein